MGARSVGALVHGRVPAARGATVRARALAPWVACRLVGLLTAGNIAPLDCNDAKLGVSQLLEGPDRQVTAGTGKQQMCRSDVSAGWEKPDKAQCVGR